jgi:hypothetical protein
MVEGPAKMNRFVVVFWSVSVNVCCVLACASKRIIMPPKKKTKTEGKSKSAKGNEDPGDVLERLLEEVEDIHAAVSKLVEFSIRRDTQYEEREIRREQWDKALRAERPVVPVHTPPGGSPTERLYLGTQLEPMPSALE